MLFVRRPALPRSGNRLSKESRIRCSSCRTTVWNRIKHGHMLAQQCGSHTRNKLSSLPATVSSTGHLHEVRRAFRIRSSPSTCWNSPSIRKLFTTASILLQHNPNLTRPRYESEIEQSWVKETRRVRIGGKESVPLYIYKPKRIQSSTADTTNIREASSLEASDVLVYLPPGPLLPGRASNSERDLQDILLAIDLLFSAETPRPIVIHVGYRLSAPQAQESDDFQEDHRFPSPIHDVTTAFDWIKESGHALVQAPSKQEIHHKHGMKTHKGRAGAVAGTEIGISPTATEHMPNIYIYGKEIGGAMALMLALTKPNDIKATMVHDPIVDWTGLDEIASVKSIEAGGEHQVKDQDENMTVEGASISISKRRSRKRTEKMPNKIQTAAAAKALIHTRTLLFRNPSGFFDSFASPVLFLRAPGKDTPLWRTARPEVEQVESASADYGPYDDDWHAADHHIEGTRPAQLSHDEGAKVDAIVDALGTDSMVTSSDLDDGTLSSPLSSVTLAASASPTTQSQNGADSQDSVSESSSASTPNDDTKEVVKRRKVLRRWPPAGRPEDVLLPYIKVYSSPTTTWTNSDTSALDLRPILQAQAREMVDLLRKACFWGRDVGWAEERVQLEVLGSDPGSTGRSEDGKSEAGAVSGTELDAPRVLPTERGRYVRNLSRGYSRVVQQTGKSSDRAQPAMRLRHGPGRYDAVLLVVAIRTTWVQSVSGVVDQ